MTSPGNDAGRARGSGASGGMESPDERRPRRPRDAAASRTAILEAARVCFTADSYDAVGVRDIAAAAGVDPALVIRYFGSKQSLFAAAVVSGFGQTEILGGDRAELGARLARMIATKQAHHGFDPMTALIRSSLSPTTSGLIREVIDEQVIEPLAAWIGGEQAELRAALLMSHLLGLFVGRMMLQHKALATADPDTLAAILQPILQSYVDGPIVQPAEDQHPSPGP